MQITCHKFCVNVREIFINSNFKINLSIDLDKFMMLLIWIFNIWFNGIEFANLKFAM